ncbi:hypothetical protein [Streptomyces werraensis]|uniref:hypothetical protein n=1 Tax=Streptomyces werraensis TaxID=68284 RepID=UPI003416D8D8
MSDMRLRMRRCARQVLAWVVGLTALVVVVAVAVSNSRSEPDVDRESYEKGYHSLHDAWLPPAEDDREVTEEYCGLLWGEMPSKELYGVVKEDWIDGCADFREGRPSRFSSD